MYRQEMLPKAVSEQKRYHFDFTGDVDASITLGVVTVTCTVFSGDDGSPSSMLSGVGVVDGLVVGQVIRNGVVGNVYEVKCRVATSDGQILVKSGYLAVVPDL